MSCAADSEGFHGTVAERAQRLRKDGNVTDTMCVCVWWWGVMLEHLLIPPWGKKDKGSTTCPADCPVLPRGHLDSHESTQEIPAGDYWRGTPGKTGFPASAGETEARHSTVGASYTISVRMLFRKQKDSLVPGSGLMLNEYLLNE